MDLEKLEIQIDELIRQQKIANKLQALAIKIKLNYNDKWMFDELKTLEREIN